MLGPLAHDDGKLEISPNSSPPCCPAAINIALLIRGVIDGQSGEDAELSRSGQALLDGLQPYLQAGSKQSVTAAADSRDRLESLGRTSVENGNWHLSLRFGVWDSLREGIDPWLSSAT